MLLAYDGPRRCYFRRVDERGWVAGGFGSVRDGGCPFLVGYASGHVGAGRLPFERALDVSDPGRIVPLSGEDPAGRPQAGDAYLGLCSDYMSEDDVGYATYSRWGCAYSPGTRTLYRLQPVLAIDAKGRTWSGSGRAVVVSDGTQRWRSRTFPAHPLTLVTSSGDSAAVLLDDGAATILVTSDAGRSWRKVDAVPFSTRGADPTMLADGRLVLGPGNGQVWRGTDATNTTFEAVEAGLLTTVTAAGDRLYGLTESDDTVLNGMVWSSKDAGATWRPVIDARRAFVPDLRPVPADQLRPVEQPPVAELIKQLVPADVAVSAAGAVLVIHGKPSTGGRTAWRLYGRRDRVLAEGPGGNEVMAAGNGFLLRSAGVLRFVDAVGQVRVNWDETSSRPVRRGDLFIPEHHDVYRPSSAELFNGLAEPDGVVSAVDDDGRMWALGRHPRGRTVVRSALPGDSWRSRELGRSIGASEVQGVGSNLTVIGHSEMYVSKDAGATWALVRHGASTYGGGPPGVTVLPDGRFLLGDDRAGYRVSDDLRTFRDLPAASLTGSRIGPLAARGVRNDIEVSVDRRHWERFTPSAARRLLTSQEAQ
jgi:hypothetical protein